MNKDKAVKILGDALQYGDNDYLAYVAKMRNPGVILTRWERWRIRFWHWLGKDWRAQRIILRILQRANR